MDRSGNEAGTVTRVVVCAVQSANLLGEVIRAHPEMELAECLRDPDRLESTLVRTGAASIILGAEVPDPVGRCRQLLRRFPGLRILALCDAERSAVLLRAGEPPLELCDLSLVELLNSITDSGLRRMPRG